MDLFDDHFTSILNSFGMTKWTPSITGYPVYGSKVWDEFVNSIWYGELEFYFSTICGLILSILMYYGRTSEEITNEDETMDSSYHIHVNSLHQHFIQLTFPSLVRSSSQDASEVIEEEAPNSPVKKRTKQIESVYRTRHNERMYLYSLFSLFYRSKLVNTRSDSIFLTIQQIKASESLARSPSNSDISEGNPPFLSSRATHSSYSLSPPVDTLVSPPPLFSPPLASVAETEESPFLYPTIEDMDIDLIPDAPSSSHLLPTENSLPLSLHLRSVSILDNETAVLRNAETIQPKQGELLFTPMEDSEDSSQQYINEIGETITNTWLVIYSVVIRVLDFLVTVSLSYEKHALSLLRVFSIIALVICCMILIYSFSLLGGQETVDGGISILLLPLLIFNTSFDMYKRSLFIVYVKLFTTTAEYWVDASIAGSFVILS